jgi:hypothetical protein
LEVEVSPSLVGSVSVTVSSLPPLGLLSLVPELGVVELGLVLLVLVLVFDLVVDDELLGLGLGLLFFAPLGLGFFVWLLGLFVALPLELELTLIEQAGSTRLAPRSKARTVGLRCMVGLESAGTDGHYPTAIQAAGGPAGTFQDELLTRGPQGRSSFDLRFAPVQIRPFDLWNTGHAAD